MGFDTFEVTSLDFIKDTTLLVIGIKNYGIAIYCTHELRVKQ
jgi:hypothetical protein